MEALRVSCEVETEFLIIIRRNLDFNFIHIQLEMKVDLFVTSAVGVG
jgi:hypothetical protein